MRTPTAQQLATLQANPGYASYTRVRVLRGATWEDLSALTGLQLAFLDEVEVSESIETPVAQATVRCAREVHGFSLAPLITTSPLNLPGGSYDPLLLEGRTFVVEGAVVPLGMEPASGDWIEMFRGRIDEVDVGGEGLSFAGRDHLGGLLQDSYIEEENVYGDDDPVLGDPVQDVMSEIIDDNTILGGSALSTPVDPSWRLGKFVQKGQSVHDALDAITAQIGWEIREKDYLGTRLLVFWSPDRSATSPVWIFTADDYEYLGEVRTSIEDVRNLIEVVYSDKDDLDAAGVAKRKTVQVFHTASILAYGRRFMRIAEAATSNIDTSSEATTLANNAKMDLAERPLGMQLEVAFHPFLELGDLVAVEHNGVHFTETQTAAVRELVHSFSPNTGGSTKVTLLGKPSASRRRWLSMEQRPTTAPSSPFTGPDAPEGLTSATVAGGVVVKFSPPVVGPAATSYELHVSTSSGFTPTDATRRVVGSLTEMTVPALTAGTTYYVKVVPRDAKGNRGAASSELTLVPRFVEPRTLQPRISWGNLPLNGDFESQSLTTAPPDAWSFSGTWGTHADVTTTVLSGKLAVQFANTATTTTLTAQPFTVREGEVWVFSAFYRQSSGSSTSGVLAFTYLDANLSAISAVSVSLGASTPANTWTRAHQRVTIPSGARFGEVSFSRSGSYSGTLTVDSVDAMRGVAWGTWQNLSYDNSWSDANVGVYGNAQYRVNDLGEVELRGVILSPSSAPAANASAFTLPAEARPADYARVFDRATSGGLLARFTFSTTGSAQVASIAASVSVSLDGIRFFTS